jgi:hypothetical protein
VIHRRPFGFGHERRFTPRCGQRVRIEN